MAIAQVSAMSADISWQRLFDQSVDLVVEGVFRRTLNLRSEPGGELFTLFLEDSYGAPRAMSLSLLGYQPVLRQGDVGRFAEGRLHLPGMSISVDGCQLIDNSLPITDRPSDRSVAWLNDYVQGRAMAGSFYGAVEGDSMSQAIVERLNQARLAIQGEVSADSIGQLIGLGIGLTPSGDDYLVGYLAAIWHDDSRQSEKELLRQTVLRDLGRTTSVSRLYLSEASDGNFAEPIRELCQLMAADDRSATKRATAVLLGHGATSGQDILTGMIDAWNKNKE